MAIKIRVDTGPYLRDLEQRFLRQIPFATALALTRTAQDARDALRATLSRHFTIRSNWVKKGLQIKPATKADQRAIVGSKDTFMRLQAVGGTKRPRRGRLAIPVRARASLVAITRPSRWPGKLLRKRGYYSAPAGEEVGVWKGKRNPELWWRLVRKVRVPARWPFQRIVEAVVRRQWPIRMRAALVQAMAGKKGPKGKLRGKPRRTTARRPKRRRALRS